MQFNLHEAQMNQQDKAPDIAAKEEDKDEGPKGSIALVDGSSRA